MRRQYCCNGKYFSSYCLKGRYAIAFGLGLMISCFCPANFLFFTAALVIIVLGFALLKC